MHGVQELFAPEPAGLFGLLVLASVVGGSIVALLFLALKAGNMSAFSFSKTYQVKAAFDNIGGLKARAAVKSAGVVVGRVDSIAFDDKSYQATVTLALEKRYAFPKDSSLKILTSGLLGEQYIGLTQGGDEEHLAAGDTISITSSAMVLENLIGRLMTSFTEGSAKPAEEGGSEHVQGDNRVLGSNYVADWLMDNL